MQRIGEHENLQTLFCELRLVDESQAPRFSVVWNSAQARTGPRRWFTSLYIAASAVLVISLVSFALWLSELPSNLQQEFFAVIPSSSPAGDSARELLKQATKLVVVPRVGSRESAMRRGVRLAAIRRSRMLALREAEMRNAFAISSWQSPTAVLMRSPADDVLTWLPHLNQSVEQVNSFLSDTQN